MSTSGGPYARPLSLFAAYVAMAFMSRCHIVSFHCCRRFFLWKRPDTAWAQPVVGYLNICSSVVMQRRLKAWMGTPWRWLELRSVSVLFGIVCFFSLLDLREFGSYISTRAAASQKQGRGRKVSHFSRFLTQPSGEELKRRGFPSMIL